MFIYKKNLLVLLTVALMTVIGYGDTIYVDCVATGIEDGTSWSDAFTTIQDGIDAASNGDVVEVNECTYYENVDFDGKAITVRNNDPADPCMVASTVIDGNNGGTVVKFKTSEDADSVLTGFTITGGYAMGHPEYGGGIYCSSASPTISNCVIKDNYSGSTYGFNSGGGLRTNAASPTVTDCVFQNNSTNGYGGGIGNWSQSNPTITNCTFIDNHAPMGGGISNYESSPTISKCMFITNEGDNAAGGVFNAYSSAEISYCVFSGNDACGVYGMGGAIYNATHYSGEITNCLFSQNEATDHGGAIFTCYYSEANIINCTFSENSAAYGGALMNYQSDPKIINCILWDDTATMGGNEVYNSSGGDPNFMFCNIEGCGGSDIGWDPNIGIDGGGNIDQDPCFVDAGSNDFHLNYDSPCINKGDPSGDYSGQTDIDGDIRELFSQVDIGADEFSMVYNLDQDEGYDSIQGAIDDAATGETIEVGPGIYYESINFDGLAITVRSSDPNDANVVAATVIDANGGTGVTFNSSEDANSLLTGFMITGGRNGIYCNGSSPSISNCVITDNSNNTWGGGMFIINNSSPTITDCAIKNNSASRGGGMLNDGYNTTLFNCVFSDNSASEVGGAILNFADSNVTARGCLFNGNTAAVGGGIYSYQTTDLTLTNCTFYGNVGTASGGAMWSRNSDLDVNNCVFYDNSSGSYGGGALYHDAVTSIFSNCTFSQNTTTSNGGAMWNTSTNDQTVVNCIFWDNSASGSGDEVYNVSVSSEPNFSYCNIENCGGSGGGWDTNIGSDDGGNIDQDPCFVNSGSNDFHLLSDSPCINAGDPNGDYSGQTDIDGDPRVVGQIVDMGADETLYRVNNVNDSIWYVTINNAIDVAGPNDEIVVYQGTYYESVDFDDKAITVRSSDPNDADVVDATVIDANGGNYGVEFSLSETSSSVLKGFTITGAARSGIYCSGTSPTIEDCNVVGNGGSSYDGGGMLNDDASPTVSRCVFTDNTGDWGGGMFNEEDSSPTVVNCVFAYNNADDGGGMNSYNSSPEVINCVFYDNTSTYDGGGMYIENPGDVNIINCTFYDNYAGDDGGGIYCYDGTTIYIRNCILWNNQADDSGGEVYNSSCDVYVYHSCIEGDVDGDKWGGDDSEDEDDNTDSDPDFVDDTDPDGDDDVWATSDDGLVPTDTDVVDEGENDYIDGIDEDIKGDDRIINDDVDMGAYEYVE